MKYSPAKRKCPANCCRAFSFLNWRYSRTIYSNSPVEISRSRLACSFQTIQAFGALPFLHLRAVVTRFANEKNDFGAVLCNANFNHAPKYRKDKEFADLLFTIVPRVRFRFTPFLKAILTTSKPGLKFYKW